MTKSLLKHELLNIIETELVKKSNLIIAIDGRCGSGKSTFADKLAKDYGFQIVHMDDFYLPLDMRNPERFQQIGGNIHTERFSYQVFDNIKKKNHFFYTKFDCKLLAFTKGVKVMVNKPIVIEGAYSMLEQFREIYDMKIFMDIDKQTQKERIVKRNGEKDWINFETKWIPKEEKYLKEKAILSVCDYQFILN